MSRRQPVAELDLVWAPLPDRPVLTSGAVHLVSCQLNDEWASDTGHQLLMDLSEAARAARFRHAAHRHRWVAGRALLKRLLARYAGCEVGAIRLGAGAVGKPCLCAPDDTGIRFNYTDSGGRLMYAFGRDSEVGLDLEVLPRTVNHAALASRKLSTTEFAAYEGLPAEHRAHAFLANWTRKEAYGKALGVGVRFPMHEVTLCEDYSKPYQRVTVDGAHHHLTQVKPPFPGIACVVVSGGGRPWLEGYTLAEV